MKSYSRRLTYSEVKYGYLRIEKDYADQCPNPGENIIVNGAKLKMHSSQPGRIDGLTELYKINKAKIGENASIIFKSRNEITVSFGKGADIFELENKVLHEQTSMTKILERIRELCKTKHTYFAITRPM